MITNNFLSHAILCLTIVGLGGVKAHAAGPCGGVPDGESDAWPFPYDCTKYIECTGSVATVRNCPDGFWFSPTILACNLPELSGCTAGNICPPGMLDYLPDPYSCESYFECYDGQVFYFTCSSGMWFNQYEKRCTDPTESACGPYATTTLPPNICSHVPTGSLAYFPHDCTSFYECLGPTPTPAILPCPPDLFFDPDVSQCVDYRPTGC